VLSRFSVFPTAKHDPELHPFRPGLVFAFFNALAWQIGIGTPMVLFAEELGASPFQVGLAYSFVFVLTPVQIVATALLPRFGFKALMLGGWRTRSFFLGVPAVLALLAMRGGERPWMIDAMVWSVFFFCLFRSIGAASGTSWFYAILPEAVRGRYFASDQFVSAVAGVGTLLASAALFALLPVYPALLAQYLIALLGSTISYYSLKRLPDAERPRSISLRTVLRDTPRHLFAPSTFRRYVWLAAVCAVLATPIPPFAAYYLKVGPQLATGQIMLFEVLRYAGVMVAAWVIRRRIDVTGARPFFMLALGVYAVVGVYWWFYLENGFGGIAGICCAYFLLGLGVATWSIANLNYLPKVVSAEERTLVVSVHGAVTACIGGLSPVVWGLFLKTGGSGARGIDTDVFQWFFVSVIVGAVVLFSLLGRLPEEKGQSVEPILIGNAILRPFRAMTYLVNLVEVRNPANEAAKDQATKR
jgi:MFS family permease